MDYELHHEDRDINWFLDTVIVRDIEAVINAGAGYLAFSLVAQAIELLGALLDEEEFHEPGLSESRFAKAIDALFEPINVDYLRHNKADSDYYLWKFLRCGMAHVLRPNSRLVFTGRGDAARIGYRHLQVVELAGYEKPQLVLVIEDLHVDLREACRRAKNLIKRKTHPKLQQGYISVTTFHYAFVNPGDGVRLDWPKGQTLEVATPSVSGGPIIKVGITGSRY